MIAYLEVFYKFLISQIFIGKFNMKSIPPPPSSFSLVAYWQD